jgi:hypothetical protein
MHIARLDLNLLVVFDTIYAEANITRASRRLNLSQPAISHALGRLRQVEDPLFIRHGRQMTPTPLARRMIEPVRQSLQTIEATLTEGHRFAPSSAVKHFTVGMRDALEAAVLGGLMRARRPHQAKPTSSSSSVAPTARAPSSPRTAIVESARSTSPSSRSAAQPARAARSRARVTTTRWSTRGWRGLV